MKVLVIKSSPRKKGNSNTLADEFIRGAQVHALGVLEAGAVAGTKYMQEAYELGKSL
jgi:multimeric flavodoxin WrbA